MKSNKRVYAALIAGIFVVSFLGIIISSRWRTEKSINLQRALVGRWAVNPTNTFGLPISLTNISRVTGHAESALYFDGVSSRAWVPDSPDLALRAGSDFSITAWIQPETANTSFGVMSIVEKRKVGGIVTALGFSFHLEYGCLATQISPEPGFKLTRADVFSPTSWILLWKNRHALAVVNRFVAPGPDLRDGRFHHVALTVARNSKTGGNLFVDGKLVLTFDPTTVRGSLANKEPLLIGTHPDTSLRCGFKGKIEDVRFYSRALSPEEVATAAE